MIKVFLSYSNLDKSLAGQVKEELDSYGVDVFLAHDDIEPAEVWVERLLQELKGCDVFIPILTNHFNDSNWTDQETGIAYTLEKLIIPLKVSVDPHGFISRFQAVPLRLKSILGITRACERIVEVLASHPTLSNAFREGLVQKFIKSRSREKSEDMVKLLNRFDDYSRSQLTDIAEHAVKSKILRSDYIRDELRELIHSNEKNIHPKLVKAFDQAAEYHGSVPLIPELPRRTSKSRRRSRRY